MTSLEPFAYPLLLVVSFGAATILPFSSEGLLAAMLYDGRYDPLLLWLTATAGNVGGALLNWWLGAFLLSFAGRRGFPFTPLQIDRAAARYGRYGVWTLLWHGRRSSATPSPSRPECSGRRCPSFSRW